MPPEQHNWRYIQLDVLNKTVLPDLPNSDCSLSLQGVRVREAGLRGELEAQATEMTRLREQLRECQEKIPGGATQVRSHFSGHLQNSTG